MEGKRLLKHTCKDAVRIFKQCLLWCRDYWSDGVIFSLHDQQGYLDIVHSLVGAACCIIVFYAVKVCTLHIRS